MGGGRPYIDMYHAKLGEGMGHDFWEFSEPWLHDECIQAGCISIVIGTVIVFAVIIIITITITVTITITIIIIIIIIITTITITIISIISRAGRPAPRRHVTCNLSLSLFLYNILYASFSKTC